MIVSQSQYVSEFRKSWWWGEGILKNRKMQTCYVDKFVTDNTKKNKWGMRIKVILPAVHNEVDYKLTIFQDITFSQF